MIFFFREIFLAFSGDFSRRIFFDFLVKKMGGNLNIAEIVNDTIINRLDDSRRFDLTFTKGVLIHINPDKLAAVYDNLYRLSSRYILVCEYYNPSPVSISYHGNDDRLFKRDFAGEMIDRFNLKLIDYGFNYQRDMYHTNDDTTWFLMEKT